jgi:glycosyltransferase involved in cell wall biosynthesis
LSKEKGIDVLLEAFEGSGYKLRIAGAGPMEERVKAAVSDRVVFLGSLPKDQVIHEMKRCRALVFPSIWFEGMPMTILEAFSTGCPVVASNLGAMSDLIEDGVNGVHFEVGDSNALRNALDRVTEAMGESARQEYLNKFTPEANYSMLMDIYQHAIANSGNKIAGNSCG